MDTFSNVVIIFNPMSTGNSVQLAKQLARELRIALPNTPVTLLQTEYAGHAEAIASECITHDGRTLLVSSSGDGGYHEVVNGALATSQKTGIAPYCAVLPAGNANGHYHAVYNRPLLEAIIEGVATPLDVLTLSHGKRMRYAHSYIGLGLTPAVAEELNRHKLSRIKEIQLAIRTFRTAEPVQLDYNGQNQLLDSFIATNIGSMAKHLQLSTENAPNDGIFEVIAWPHRGKRRLFWQVIGTMVGLRTSVQQATTIALRSADALSFQLDGELYATPKDTTIQIAISKHAINMVK